MSFNVTLPKTISATPHLSLHVSRQARLTPIDHTRLDHFGAQPEDFEMEMEDGNGTMVDFTLQEGSLHDSHGRDSRWAYTTLNSG